MDDPEIPSSTPNTPDDSDWLRHIAIIFAINHIKQGGLPVLKPRKLASRKSPNSYPYSPLPLRTSIRVLKVLPETLFLGREDFIPIAEELKFPIRCHMRVVDLEEDPDYEALSYTWGDPLVFYQFEQDVFTREEWYTPCFDIYVNDKLVSVTTNLFTALLARRMSVRCQSSSSSTEGGSGACGLCRRLVPLPTWS